MDNHEVFRIKNEIEVEYWKFVLDLQRTTSPRFKMAGKDYISPGFLHASMGMVTEAAEILDLCKKGIGYNRSVDMIKVKKELGDSLYYWTLAVIESGTSFDEMMSMNMIKLKARYADGYTDEEANNRNLIKEHEALDCTRDLQKEHEALESKEKSDGK